MMSTTKHLEKEKGVIIMSSHQCLVPNWNLKEQQRQEQVEVREEGCRSSHVHSNHQNYPDTATTLHVPMPNYDEVGELTWEKGQRSMHGLGGLIPTSQEKPTLWGKAYDTLESIVQQATSSKSQKSKLINEHHHASTSASSIAASSGEQYQLVPALARKRSRSECDQHGRSVIISSKNNMVEECDHHHHPSGGCASGSATFCRDNETATMTTWASLESDWSFNNKTIEEDSAFHYGSENQDNQDERDTKVETGQSNSTRRNRTAAIHNQSERRRRDRINQKMKVLQRLVPNASKTDKASMLEEVINYLKQLQAQIQMMSMTSMPQMMVPLAMQQQLQMSMLARMRGLGLGIGMGMGMVNINNMAPQHTASAPRPFPQLIQPTTTLGGAHAATGPIFVAPSFMMPASLIQPHHPKPSLPASAASATNASSIPLPDPFSTASFAQSVNMDLFNNMAALYRQQMMSQNNQALSSLPQTNHEQGN